MVVTADGFVDFEDERYDDDAEAFMIDNKPLNRETTSTLADMILAKLKEAESLGQKKTCSVSADFPAFSSESVVLNILILCLGRARSKSCKDLSRNRRVSV